eukprot:3941591-Rhodomonas_salina.1
MRPRVRSSGVRPSLSKRCILAPFRSSIRHVACSHIAPCAISVPCIIAPYAISVPHIHSTIPLLSTAHAPLRSSIQYLA